MKCIWNGLPCTCGGIEDTVHECPNDPYIIPPDPFEDVDVTEYHKLLESDIQGDI